MRLFVLVALAITAPGFLFAAAPCGRPLSAPMHRQATRAALMKSGGSVLILLLFALIGRVRRCLCTRNFPGIASSLFFTMSRIDFAGEFRREAINNNGGQTWSSGTWKAVRRQWSSVVIRSDFRKRQHR
jgi:hypothetical protein